jgi:hypothetical protein
MSIRWIIAQIFVFPPLHPRISLVDKRVNHFNQTFCPHELRRSFLMKRLCLFYLGLNRNAIYLKKPYSTFCK